MKGRFVLRSFFVLLVSVICMPAAIAGIATTKHNLSISGPGEVKATTEQRLCVFCHTPHRAISNIDGVTVPLWNHTLSNAVYMLYSSPTLLSPPLQPDGSSRLCLSCHDGTVALGSVVNTGTSLSSIGMMGTGGSGEMPAGPSNVGTDLSGDHPISLEINTSLIDQKEQQCTNGEVVFKICRPPAGSPVLLEKTNNRFGGTPSGVGVQCSTCHDPHEDPVPGVSVFLRTGDRNSHDQLCSACHIDDCAAPCP